MNQLLQDAITATRSGNKKTAQLLLTKNLKENPEDVHAWYLLGMLMDSKERQAVYLGKALALDPAHHKARARLAALAAASTIAISEEPLDFEAQAEGDTLPEWLAVDADALQLERVGMRLAVRQVVEEPSTGEAATAVADPTDDTIPDWLQQEVNPTWVTQEPPTQISPFPQKTKEAPQPNARPAPKPTKARPAPRKKAAPKRPRTKQEQKSQLNLALGILIVAMLLVVLLLFYVAL